MNELLILGVTRLGRSPYSSLVSLVRKADEIWRMGVDYLALNSVTIKNKFLIPFIEELSYKLSGFKFFSKLDLLSEYHKLRSSL